MNALTFRPEYAHKGEAFQHSWEGMVNIDQFRWMVRRDTLEHLKVARDELGARHVRAVGMFDDEMRVLGKDPAAFRNPDKKGLRLNWQVVDYVIDSLLDIGIQPLFTTTFTPGGLASGTATTFETKSRISPPRSLSAWSDLVKKGVEHMTWRYGSEITRGWYYEVWNEPNLHGFWDGTREQFFELWQATYEAVKSVDSSYRVGGPSTARAEWVRDLIEFGRSHQCEPDYIISHIYNNDSESSPLSPFDGPQEDKISRSPHFASGVIRGVRKLLSGLDFRGEVHWNEWGRSWFPYAPARETPNEAAFVAKTMAEVSQVADYFGYWNLSDIYDQVGYGAETFHGNYGMLNLQGLRKPVWHGFQLLSRLGHVRIPCEGENLSPLAGGISTRSDHGFELLVFSFSPVDAPETIAVNVALPASLDGKHLTLHRVAGDENNILSRWQAMGSPAYLKRDQLRELREQNHLTAAASTELRLNSAKDMVTFQLSGPGVALLEIRGEA